MPRLQSTNQSIFSRKLAFLVVSVYHNYLLSPPSCLGMTPLCWGRSRTPHPPLLERLRAEASKEQSRWRGRRRKLATNFNAFANIFLKPDINEVTETHSNWPNFEVYLFFLNVIWMLGFLACSFFLYQLIFHSLHKTCCM